MRQIALLALLLAFAAANLGAGMVGCCPVNGSVSRSSMNVQYRGKTQAVSLVAAAGMAAVLLWGSGLIRLLPVPVLLRELPLRELLLLRLRPSLQRLHHKLRHLR